MPPPLPSRFIDLAVRGLLVLTAAQALASIVFFFAANWWGWSPISKRGLIDGAIVLAALVAAMSQRSFPRAVAATAGAVLGGLLFAVHGQIWQSGADAWELFAVWTVIALIWAVVSLASGAWCIAALMACLTVAGYLEAHPWITSSSPLGWLAAPLMTAAGLRLACGMGPGRTRPPQWLIAGLVTATAVCLAAATTMALPDGHGIMALSLALGALAIASLAWPPIAYPWLFAVGVGLAVYILEASLIVHAVDAFGSRHGELAWAGFFLALALAVLAGLAGAARAILWAAARHNTTSGSLSPAHRPPENGSAVILAIRTGIGLGAWIAVGLGIAAVILLCVALDLGIQAGGLMVAVLGGGLAGVMPHSTFTDRVRHALICFSYAGFLVAFSDNGRETTIPALMALPLLAPAAILAPHSRSTGVLCAVIAAAVITAELFHHAGRATFQDFPIWLAILHAAVFCVLGWLAAIHGKLPVVQTMGNVFLLAAFIVPIALDVSRESAPGTPLSQIGPIVAAGGLLAATLVRRPAWRHPSLIAVALLCLGAAALAPSGLAAVIGLSSVAVLRRDKILAICGLTAGAWTLSRFYYLLSVPLAIKAQWLACGALLTGAAAAIILWRRWEAHRHPLLRITPARLALAGLCAVLPIGGEALLATGKQEVVAHGREILLPMAPADPRSLFQGDYMAIRYAPVLTEKIPKRADHAFLRLDASGMAREARPASGPIAGDEILVQVHSGAHGPRLGPESFLFEEGTASVWQRARFVVARVHDGSLVVTGLAAADGSRLSPQEKIAGTGPADIAP